MFEFLAFAEGGMNKGVQIPELKLEGGRDACLAGDLSQRLHNVQGMLDVSLVVVGQVVDEQAREIKLIHKQEHKFKVSSGSV
jgi:hypothetical protein